VFSNYFEVLIRTYTRSFPGNHVRSWSSFARSVEIQKSHDAAGVGFSAGSLPLTANNHGLAAAAMQLAADGTTATLPATGLYAW
jgi:hypothetical protein